MTFVAAGSSLGTLIHPIGMLNDLFSRVGYGKTTIFSAALVAFMLLDHSFLWLGIYYPFFFLQLELDASKHGINETLNIFIRYVMTFYHSSLGYSSSFLI